MKIIWLSANKFGYALLEEAMKPKGVKIDAIITLSDRSRTVMYDGIKTEKWNKFGIKVYEIEKINEEKKLISEILPELVVMCGWRQIVDKEVLKIPHYGFVGFHPTLLPVGRGPAPIINSILNGFKESGVSMFYVSDGLDDGDIIGQERFKILERDHAWDVYRKAINAGKKLIRKYLPLIIIKGNAPRIPQDNLKAIIFNKPSLKDNKIDLNNETLDEIYLKIRALSKPYKGAYIEKDGKKLIIWKAELK